LRQLSELNVARGESIETIDAKQSTVLLQKDVRDHMGRQGNDADHSMRRNGTGRRSVESTSQPRHEVETSSELYANRVNPEPDAPTPEETTTSNEVFDDIALGAVIREGCMSARILAIKDSSVVVSLGRGNKAIIHNVSNAQHFTVEQIVTIINKQAKLERPIEKDEISR
jgi:hypothetical protein